MIRIRLSISKIIGILCSVTIINSSPILLTHRETPELYLAYGSSGKIAFPLCNLTLLRLNEPYLAWHMGGLAFCGHSYFHDYGPIEPLVTLIVWDL